jgi:NUDIX domain
VVRRERRERGERRGERVIYKNKGLIDEGETVEQAALRELCEECGYGGEGNYGIFFECFYNLFI